MDLLLCTNIINYINVLNPSQTGLEWRHSDFFSLLRLLYLEVQSVVLKVGNCFFHKLMDKNAFFSVSVSFLTTQNGKCARLLGKV